MNRIIIVLALAIAMAACARTPTRLVYSSGFSFANYDYVVVAKPEGKDTATSLYGMDVEFANLLSRYTMKVIGDKEYESMPLETKQRTLFARMSITASVTASDQIILLSVSFDDLVTGRTGASISSFAKGNIFDVNHRTRAFEIASSTIIKALEKDKGLQVTHDKVRP